MAKVAYRVEVKEAYRTYVEVEAASESEARDIVEKRIADGDVVVLDTYSHLDQEITVRLAPIKDSRQRKC